MSKNDAWKVPLGEWAALNVPVGSCAELNVPLGSWAALNVPVGEWAALKVPVGSCAALKVPLAPKAELKLKALNLLAVPVVTLGLVFSIFVKIEANVTNPAGTILSPAATLLIEEVEATVAKKVLDVIP